ncbi:hypothetical protein GCM10010252_72440 [Streptomyces aureoverticillatus]|nr:hypothetical protein GCM10010252_72440 [Streptomyces aureoverticillatus]
MGFDFTAQVSARGALGASGALDVPGAPGVPGAAAAGSCAAQASARAAPNRRTVRPIMACSLGEALLRMGCGAGAIRV